MEHTDYEDIWAKIRILYPKITIISFQSPYKKTMFLLTSSCQSLSCVVKYSQGADFTTVWKIS